APSDMPTDDPVGEPEEPAYTEEDIKQCVDKVTEMVSDLYYNNEIAYYETYEDHVVIQLNSGAYYMYIPEIPGFDSGTEGTLNIATYQHCVSGYPASYADYMRYPDEAAERIESTFPMYVFDGDGMDYNDGEVSADTLFTMPEYNVILWHGHGGYSGAFGSAMVTGIPITEENDKALYSLLSDGSLALSNSNYLVTPIFFEKHVADGAFDNSIVYLGTCSSGMSDRLAQAVLDKGAEEVYDNSGRIHTDYNLDMMNAVVEGLCSTHEDGRYYNVREALDFAKEREGEYDRIDRYTNTYVNLYTNDEIFSLDWYEDHMIVEREVVLVLDISGSMDGTPMTETKEAAKGFVDSVLDAKAAVSLVTYDTYAEVRMGFTRRESALKSSIDSIYTRGSTNIYDGLRVAAESFDGSEAKKKIIVLMGDGVPNEGLQGEDLYEYADSLREQGIYIYALGFFHNLGDYDKAYAQDILRNIADEGSYHDVADAADVSFVFDDVAEEITGERKIYIRIACPVDVEVICDGETLSKNNPRTSFGSLSFELPEGEEGESDTSEDVAIEDNTSSVKIVRLKEGLDYDINIEGTGNGSMDYTIGFMNADGEYDDFREFRNVKIKRTTLISTKANYSDTTTMTVDEDGDGKDDYVYRAEKDSRAEKKEVGLDWRLMLALVGAGIAVLAVISLVVSLKIFNKATAALSEQPAAPAEA
ncbi:MAG: VWA domain-containing protein, partial [Clostridia bacterium]|nr:VWA domain-containing protein [Clostridia bacterium]